MNINFLSKSIAPLAAVAALSMAAPASAAVFFGNGDSLNIGSGYQTSTATPSQYKFSLFGGGFANVGSYGNTNVTSTSDGAFEPFITDAVKPLYGILSIDFSDASTYLNKAFLSINTGVDAFTFTITGPAVEHPVADTDKLTNVAYSFGGIFKSLDDQTLGEGTLTSNFSNKNGKGSYSAILVVTKAESVPEPSALLGIGLMVGAVYVIRRRQVAIA